jgi:hypothetical protein
MNRPSDTAFASLLHACRDDLGYPVARDGGLEYIRQHPAGQAFGLGGKTNLYGLQSPQISVDRLVAYVNIKKQEIGSARRGCARSTSIFFARTGCYASTRSTPNATVPAYRSHTRH